MHGANSQKKETEDNKLPGSLNIISASSLESSRQRGEDLDEHELMRAAPLFYTKRTTPRTVLHLHLAPNVFTHKRKAQAGHQMGSLPTGERHF